MDKREARQIAQYTFANLQSDEESWYRAALSFHEGANVIGQNIDSIPRGMLVFLTNASLSIELLLKAIIVGKGGSPRTIHKLVDLAHDAKVTFPEGVEATLELLSEVLIWSGRYPAPNKEADWDRYFDNVLERHIVRERQGNVYTTRANRDTFPSRERYDEIWNIATTEWTQVQLDKQ